MFRDLYGNPATDEKTDADKSLHEETSRVGHVMVLRGRRGAKAVSSDTVREEDSLRKLDIETEFTRGVEAEVARHSAIAAGGLAGGLQRIGFKISPKSGLLTNPGRAKHLVK